LRLGDCYVRLGKLASAYAEYSDVAALARDVGDARAASAVEKAKAIEGQIPRLTIEVPPASALSDLRVLKNGAVVSPSDFNQSMAVDPGAYTIEAYAPGRLRWSVHRDVPMAASAIVVTVPPLERESNVPPPIAHLDAPHAANGQKIAGVVIGAI